MIKDAGRCRSAILAIFCLSFSSLALVAQDKRPVAYELGSSMLELLLQQKEYEGASPAALEGYRQGFEQQLAETPISVTLNDADHLTFVAGDVRQKLRYRIEGLKLMAQNIETEDYMQLGFFSKDGAKLTLINGYILDRRK